MGTSCVPQWHFKNPSKDHIVKPEYLHVKSAFQFVWGYVEHFFYDSFYVCFCFVLFFSKILKLLNCISLKGFSKIYVCYF